MYVSGELVLNEGYSIGDGFVTGCLDGFAVPGHNVRCQHG